MAQEQATILDIQMLNHLKDLSNTLFRQNLSLEVRLCCLELLQQEVVRFHYLGGFLSCNDGISVI